MDWLEFIASVLRALAWPAAIIVFALLFRTQLKELLNRIQSVKGPGGVEASFGARVADVEQSVDAFVESDPEIAEAESNGPPPTPPGENVDPSALVLSAWESLSDELFALRRATAKRGRPSNQIAKVLEQLHDEGIVNSAFVSSVTQLRGLRNEVAHARAIPNMGAALNYAEQARELSRACEVLANRATKSDG